MSLRQLRARQVTAMLLVVLLAAPAWSNPAVIGVAAGSEVARVRGAVLTAGTTIFSGDIVEVGARGRTRLTLSSGGHVVVGENSSLQLAQDENRIVFELLRGQAAFRLASPMVEARLVDVTIRTADPESTGVLLWKSPTKAVIGVEKGTLNLTSLTSGKTLTLRQGEAVEATLLPEPAAAPAPQDADSDRRRLSRRGVIILSAVLIGLTSIIGLAISAGESEPTEQQKKDAVSPFRFP